MKIADLTRNDVPAAVRYVEETLDAGRELAHEDGEPLLMLQDDGGEKLVAALEALYAQRSAAGKRVPAYWRAKNAPPDVSDAGMARIREIAAELERLVATGKLDDAVYRRLRDEAKRAAGAGWGEVAEVIENYSTR